MNSADYKSEGIHDKLLIELVKDLASIRRLDIFAKAFETDNLGCWERAQHRMLFDVELTFQNKTICVETKVDSDEDGRWAGDWQTCRIVRDAPSMSYTKDHIEYRFVTYGTAEFYTKVVDGQHRTGAAFPCFVHITLERMIEFVEEACNVLQDPTLYHDWLQAMRLEARKRAEASSLLDEFAAFRRSYLAIDGDNDFPRNRSLLCMPELAFPVFDALAREWRSRGELLEDFGDVSVYPVARGRPPIHDSIFNLWGLWCRGVGKKPFIARGLYFEINEDFNLNVKTEETALGEKGKQRVWSALDGANWPKAVVGVKRDYKQTNLVLYEIDFGFLDDVRNICKVATKLAAVLRAAINALDRL